MIEKILNWYIDIEIKYLWKINKRKFKVNEVVTWNWKSKISLGCEDNEEFTVVGFYEEGVETECGQSISNYWLRRV